MILFRKQKKASDFLNFHLYFVCICYVSNTIIHYHKIERLMIIIRLTINLI